MARKKYYVIAWGSSEYPDIDEQMDETPHNLTQKYPYSHVTKLAPIRLEDVLNEQELKDVLKYDD